MNGQFGIHFHIGLESEPERGHVVADLGVEQKYHGAEREDANWNNINLTRQPTSHLKESRISHRNLPICASHFRITVPISIPQSCSDVQ